MQFFFTKWTYFNETWHRYAPCERALLWRFSRSEVKEFSYNITVKKSKRVTGNNIRSTGHYGVEWIMTSDGRRQDFTLGHRSLTPKVQESRRRVVWVLGRECPPPQSTRGSGRASESLSKPQPPMHFWHIWGRQNKNHRPYIPTKPFFNHTLLFLCNVI